MDDGSVGASFGAIRRSVARWEARWDRTGTAPRVANPAEIRARPTAGATIRRMWDAPGRDRGSSESPGSPGGGDALGGAPDSSRPANPWPRLLAFGAVVLLMVVLTGTCLVSYARPPERELRAGFAEFNIAVPKFIPVTTFGADASGRTFGAWVTVNADGRVFAVLSRSPETGCHLRWDGGAPGAALQNGHFVDPCGPARYAADGAALNNTAPRDLHTFPGRLEGRTTVIVPIATLTLGACRADGATGCSKPQEPLARTVPNTGLPPEESR